MYNLNVSSGSHNIVQVTENNPCPVCGKPDWCHTFKDNDASLVGCQRPEKATSEGIRNYVQTKKTFENGSKYYWASKSSQQQWKENGKSQWQKTKDKTEQLGKLLDTKRWKYSVLGINENGEYQVSAKYSWYKKRDTYEKGKKYDQFGYKKGQERSILKKDLNEVFIGLYSNSPISIDNYLNHQFAAFGLKYIVVLEGEKCVDCLNKDSSIKLSSNTPLLPNFLALTSIGGASSLSAEDIQMYRKIANNNPGVPIVLSPDFDKPGYDHIRKLYESLRDLSNPILIVDWERSLSKTPELKFDMADYFDQFKEELETKTVEEFIESLTVTPNEFNWDRFKANDTKVSANKYVIETLASALETLDCDADIDYLIEGLLPSGSSVVVTAKPKTGKTIFNLDLLASVHTGECFLNRETKQAKVLYLNNDQSRKGFALQAKNRWENIAEGLSFIQGWKADDEGVSFLAEWCKDNPGSLIVLDSIRACICQPLGISQNDESTGYKIKEIIDEVSAFGCSIIFIHHDSKNKENSGTHKASGHSSITSMVDIIWHLDRDNQGNRKLKVLGSRLTDELEIAYSLDDLGKCQPIVVNSGDNDGYEYQESSANTADTLEGQIKTLLTEADRKLTTKEIMDSVGASRQGVIKALENATWVRSEKKGNSRVYWAENSNCKLSTVNCHPQGESVYTSVYSSQDADTEPVSTDELKSSLQLVDRSVDSDSGSLNDTVQGQLENVSVTNATQITLFDLPVAEQPKELGELEKTVLQALRELPLKPQKPLTIQVKVKAIEPDKFDEVTREEILLALTNMTPWFVERVGDNWMLK